MPSGGAQFEVKNHTVDRTIRIRMLGRFDVAKMRAFATAYRNATDAYRGEGHFVLADMRGMEPADPEVSAILGEAIGYARRRGVRCCVHLSDDTIQRLQARRLGRQYLQDQDDVTVEVVSLDEAEKVIKEIASAPDALDALIAGSTSQAT